MFTESIDGEIEIIDVVPSGSPIGDILQSLKFNDEGEFTITSAQQKSTETNISIYYDSKKTDSEERSKILLKRSAHRQYLIRGLHRLNSGYQSLDASQPWLCYWILNSLDLLGHIPDPNQDVNNTNNIKHETLSNVIKFLLSCVDNKFGSYGGGPYQIAHLATTYASINALCCIGTEEAYQSINRKQIYDFLIDMKDESGGFHMHEDGEMDIRATYCALSVASLLNIMDDKLTHNVGSFLQSCQTFEGGIAAEPGNEAHGGYAFCGLATGVITSTYDVLDLDRLMHWVTSRQKGYEGGFQGRTNKLVDGCYSFWQGAVLPLFYNIKPFSLKENCDNNFTTNAGTSPFEESLYDSSFLCNQRALQDYILLCCQPSGGGLRDKPPKNQDYYHTCYTLNGLSAMQHNKDGKEPTVIGNPTNLLLEVDPVHGIRIEKSKRAKEFFSKLQ